jgi:acyl carrier protein
MKKFENTSDIKQIVRDFIIKNFAYGLNNSFHVNDDESLMDAGIIDSTGVIEIISFIESEFKVFISMDEVLPENIHSIDSISEFIINKANLISRNLSAGSSPQGKNPCVIFGKRFCDTTISA